MSAIDEIRRIREEQNCSLSEAKDLYIRRTMNISADEYERRYILPALQVCFAPRWQRPFLIFYFWLRSKWWHFNP